MMKITSRQLRTIIREEVSKLRENAMDPKVDALRAFSDRFGYDFNEDPETGLPFVSDLPEEGHEIVYLNDDGDIVFGFADGSSVISLDELEAMTRSGDHPPTEFDE